MSWDKERTEYLVRLWREERLSAAAIARKIGVTRNSVISKLHRMGMTSAEGGSQRQPSGAGRNAHGLGARPRRVVPKPTPAPVEKVKTWRHWGAPAGAADERKAVEPYREAPTPRLFDHAKMVRTVDLESHHCRWPVGDPQEWDTFRHCGEAKEPGIPYCAKCAAVAYRPPNVNATGVNRAAGGQTATKATQVTYKIVSPAGEAPERELEDVS